MEGYEQETAGDLPPWLLLDLPASLSPPSEGPVHSQRVPCTCSLQQKALDCADANSEQFDRFLASIEKTRTPKDASTKEEVDAHAAKLCGLALSEASILLNGKGFLKIRRDRGLQRNLYFYQYAFMVDGQKEKPQFLNISGGRRSRALLRTLSETE